MKHESCKEYAIAKRTHKNPLFIPGAATPSEKQCITLDAQPLMERKGGRKEDREKGKRGEKETGRGRGNNIIRLLSSMVEYFPRAHVTPPAKCLIKTQMASVKLSLCHPMSL